MQVKWPVLFMNVFLITPQMKSVRVKVSHQVVDWLVSWTVSKSPQFCCIAIELGTGY